jgi:flavin reductase (DIM6/NTAB) family NADH-FMN oxidoreductase RutF
MNEIVDLFQRLTSGVFVIGVTDGYTQDAFTASSVSHVSYRPLMIAVAVNPKHAAYPLLIAGRTFTASVLEQSQIDLAARFGTPQRSIADKMHGIGWGCGKLGAPYLSGALAYFDCRLSAELAAGDHQVAVGNVIGGRILDHAGVPLRYSETGDLDRSSLLYPSGFE